MKLLDRNGKRSCKPWMTSMALDTRITSIFYYTAMVFGI